MFMTSLNLHPCVANVPIVFKCRKPSKILENPKTIGDHIRNRRLELKLLQKEVASKLGVSEATIWNWENNRTKPANRLKSKIETFLGYIV